MDMYYQAGQYADKQNSPSHILYKIDIEKFGNCQFIKDLK